MNNILSLVLGAFLAISGGAAVEWLRLCLEKRQELNFLKISFRDELSEIHSIIEKLKETWEKTNLIHKAYINDLSMNMEAYRNCRQRLFLFKDGKVRKDISSFYKELEKHIHDSEGKIGSLADTEASKNEQEKIKEKFVSFGDNAKRINSELE